MTSLEGERARVAARLAHRLESSLLLVREAAERGDADWLSEQLEELGRRARGLARACAVGPDAARALREALEDWLGPDARLEERDGRLEAFATRGSPPDTGELGEPLVRLLAAEAGCEVLSWSPGHVVVRV